MEAGTDHISFRENGGRKVTTAVLIFFSLIDMISLIGCALAVVHAIPAEREESLWKKILGWIGYGTAAFIVPSLGQNDMLTIGLLSLYYIVMARFLYFRSKQGAVYQIIYCVILLVTEYMASIAAVSVRLSMQLERIIATGILIVFRVLFLLLGTLILREIIRRRFADTQYTKISGMIIVPLFSMVLMFLYLTASDIFLVRFGYYWIFIYSILLLVINLYCLYFWHDVAKSGELKHRLKMMQQQRELTLQYYEDMEENYNRSRKIIHDIRNHLHVIEQSSRMEDKSYIEDVHAMLNSMGMKFYTENRMLNIVLNDKLKGFTQEQVKCNLGGIELDFIADLDITTIFANLLDNAVDEGKGKEDFWIQIRGEQIQDFIIIKITNPFVEYPDKGKSSKPGHEGLGLQNVRQAIEKYHGDMEIKQENGVFCVTLLFVEEEGKCEAFLKMPSDDLPPNQR